MMTNERVPFKRGDIVTFEGAIGIVHSMPACGYDKQIVAVTWVSGDPGTYRKRHPEYDMTVHAVDLKLVTETLDDL